MDQCKPHEIEQGQMHSAPASGKTLSQCDKYIEITPVEKAFEVLVDIKLT